MIITEQKYINLEDLTYEKEYVALYEKANNLRKDKFTPISHLYREKLEQIRDFESKNFFDEEKTKLDCILRDNILNYENSGLNKITLNIIEEDNGFSLNDYNEFKKELYSAIESDVMVIYDDIERNIEGRFDWMKSNEI